MNRETEIKVAFFIVFLCLLSLLVLTRDNLDTKEVIKGYGEIEEKVGLPPGFVEEIVFPLDKYYEKSMFNHTGKN